MKVPSMAKIKLFKELHASFLQFVRRDIERLLIGFFSIAAGLKLDFPNNSIKMVNAIEILHPAGFSSI